MDEQKVKPAKKPRGAAPATNGVRRKGKRAAEHPIGALAGIFENDPLWDEFVEAMQRARAAEDGMDEQLRGRHAVIDRPINHPSCLIPAYANLEQSLYVEAE
jgi:hypothetical protein